MTKANAPQTTTKEAHMIKQLEGLGQDELYELVRVLGVAFPVTLTYAEKNLEEIPVSSIRIALESVAEYIIREAVEMNPYDEGECPVYGGKT
jgi:hypothetical protein